MLVLSRRPDEKILLPSVPAVIKVISSQAGVVRLGIEAPSHVPILREELVGLERPAPANTVPQVCHAVRNGLHNLGLGLALLRLQLGECSAELRVTLLGMEEELRALRRAVASSSDTGEALSVQPTA